MVKALTALAHAVAAWTGSAYDAAASLLADGEQWDPNGTLPVEVQQMINKLLGLAGGVVSAICVGGIFLVAGRMAVLHARGEGGEHARGLAAVGAACILIGAAPWLVRELV